MAHDALIERLNRLDEAGFVSEIGALYEHSPWIAAAAWQRRPFADRSVLLAAMQDVVRASSRAEQMALIRAHPDLAGKLARAGTLEAASAREQGELGLDRLDEAEFREFDRLNTAYRERFGFPFIIAVRGQTRASVIEAFQTRLAHDEPIEIATALEQIGLIAGFRFADLI